MGEYQFEVIMSYSDIVTVEADSYDEALSLAQEEADSYYPVAPAGFSDAWDNVEVTCISEPDDSEDED